MLGSFYKKIDNYWYLFNETTGIVPNEKTTIKKYNEFFNVYRITIYDLQENIIDHEKILAMFILGSKHYFVINNNDGYIVIGENIKASLKFRCIEIKTSIQEINNSSLERIANELNSFAHTSNDFFSLKIEITSY